MRRAIAVKKPGHWRRSAAIASVTLPFEQRYKRRIRMADDAGQAFLLDLREALLLGDGDGLLLESGELIEVRAAPEQVIDIRCGDPVQCARVAWHIGNRHTALQLLDDGRLRIADDHVLQKMVEGLGATTEKTQAPFEPEGGAYSSHGGNDHAL